MLPDNPRPSRDIAVMPCEHISGNVVNTSHEANDLANDLYREGWMWQEGIYIPHFRKGEGKRDPGVYNAILHYRNFIVWFPCNKEYNRDIIEGIEEAYNDLVHMKFGEELPSQDVIDREFIPKPRIIEIGDWENLEKFIGKWKSPTELYLERTQAVLERLVDVHLLDEASKYIKIKSYEQASNHVWSRYKQAKNKVISGEPASIDEGVSIAYIDEESTLRLRMERLIETAKHGSRAFAIMYGKTKKQEYFDSALHILDDRTSIREMENLLHWKDIGWFIEDYVVPETGLQPSVREAIVKAHLRDIGYKRETQYKRAMEYAEGKCPLRGISWIEEDPKLMAAVIRRAIDDYIKEKDYDKAIEHAEGNPKLVQLVKTSAVKDYLQQGLPFIAMEFAKGDPKLEACAQQGINQYVQSKKEK